ncbi:S8 family serine peptidase [Bowmanella yangjiangensis]|uniref:S8 family serine peptidase n=1 Tax=Bowmanella yangjiangensis TaxID=2811230 RepID=UPI0022B813EF|nr:S8 family serine peptidase [Bowmanella yangjiangensis]
MRFALSKLSILTLLAFSGTSIPSLTAAKGSEDTPSVSGKFVKEPTLAAGSYRYIVQLQDAPIALYQGEIAGYAATHKGSIALHGINRQRGSDNNAVKRYRGYLQQQQKQLQQQAKQLGVTDVSQQFQHAINAMVMTMSQQQAAKLAKSTSVKSIERVKIEPLHTDSGPRWIGADQVWQGQPGVLAAQGEGIVVGIIDTGINTDHPSFADIGGDGYNHVNPYGSGVYKGDCRTRPQLCNDKLVGVYSYTEITGQYDEYAPGTPKTGEDHNGHGSHVASTAAGNVLKNVPLLDVDGDPTPGFVFPQMSGVAPHANIISYQVCYPGEDDAVNFFGCPTDLVLRAVDQAIIDGVDVLNHSIGAGASSPWQGAKGTAFLSAREAGIVVVNSAGNDGPNSETASSNAAAPWVITVGAYTHDRSYSNKSLTNFSGGNTSLSSMSGESKTGSITAPIVYAGDFTNPNDTSGDSGQCLAPFPAGTFSGQIVVCDRGDIARVDKGRHVKAGGAGGFVLANIPGGDSNLVADNHVLPAIQIVAQDATQLKTWLASGSNHRATITASQVTSDPDLANIAADFTSRGPNNQLLDVITPSVAAPGVEIWAAYADDQPSGFKETPDPADYAFLDGTSMASPHVAGAAALLKQANPSWSAAQIQSALMLTANQQTFKENGTTPSSYFDMGSGMIDVAKAVQSELIMDVSMAQYRAANPATGGTPSSLNLPSLANQNCFGSCQWTRTFTATRSGSWQLDLADTSGSLTAQFTPEQFSLNAGQSQTLTIRVDASNALSRQWQFANVVISGPEQTLNMPVAVRPASGQLPSHIYIDAKRDADSLLVKDLQTLGTNDLSAQAFGFSTSQTLASTVKQDSDNDDLFDDLSDGVVQHNFSVAPGSKRLRLEVTQTTATDLDLWIGIDSNGDGIAQESELLTSASTESAYELIDLVEPEAGSYWLLVHNWQGSSADSDTYQIDSNIVINQAISQFGVQVPDSVQTREAFDALLNWNLDIAQGDTRYGVIELSSGGPLAGDLGQIRVDFARVADDVRLTSERQGRLADGETSRFYIDIDANQSHEDRLYQLAVNLPAGLALVDGSASSGAQIDGQTIRWQRNQQSATSNNVRLQFSATANENLAAGPVQVTVDSSIVGNSYTKQERATLTTDLQVEGAPSVLINNSKQAVLSANEGTTFVITAQISDPNNDELNIVWTQSAGPTVALNTSNPLQPSLTLPTVNADTDLVFSVTATDPAGLSDSATLTLKVINQTTPPTSGNTGGGGGGSLAWWWLALGCLGLGRRAKR